MKNKVKQTLSILLVLTLVMSVFAGCENSANPNKWVLASEIYGEPANPWETIEYKYDRSGRLNYKNRCSFSNSDIIDESTYSDFVYDKSGNVTSYKESFCYDGGWGDKNTEERFWEFIYNKNNELIKSTLSISYNAVDYYKEITEFEYDDNGNLINKTFKQIDASSSTKYELSTTCKYSLTYENGLCTIAEIAVTNLYYENGDLHETDSYFYVEKHTYDSNNNKIKTNYYSASDADNSDLSINGAYYSMNDDYTTYTWQRLGDTINETTTLSKHKSDVSTIEIGFNNIDDWGGKLITIKADDSGNYVFKDSNGIYVIISEGTGIWEFYTKENYAVMSSFYVNGAYSTEASSSYTILDNDTFACNGYTMRILNRFASNGVSLIEMTNGGSNSHTYIPYAFLNSDSFELYKEDRFDYYKCYIK